MDDTAISKLSEPASGYSYKEADPNYHGEPLDPLIKHGPIEHRSCRDIICCLIFLFVWVGVFIVAGYSFSGGNPSLLLDPFDSTGFQCGVSPGY
jgi:choline transporter-like protein 2/4/5